MPSAIERKRRKLAERGRDVSPLGESVNEKPVHCGAGFFD